MRRILQAALCAVMVAGLLTACFLGDTCGSGAESAVAAVDGLLRAEGPDDQCRYLPKGDMDGASSDSAAAATAWLATVRAAVGSLNPAELRITEQSAQQMGSEYVVRITGPGDRHHDVLVLHNSGRYLVAPGATPTNPG